MTTNKVKYNKRQQIYTKIVLFFLLLTLAAIFIILHFALAKVTIKIYSPNTTQDYTSLVELLPEDSLEANSENILGKIITKELEITTSVPSSQASTPSEKAGGYVTIINNYSQNQPLVKTTRLLTTDNKLYRIQEGVTVPAGGSVEIWVEADQAGEQFAIGAGKLAIPGLRAQLQEQIYAETEGISLTSEPRYQVTAENLNQAQSKLKEEAIAQGLAAINELLPENLQIDASHIFADYQTLESSSVGEEATEATLKQAVTVYGLVFSEEDLLNIGQNKFKAELDGNIKFGNFIDNSFNYDIIEIYPERGQAVLEIKLSAQVSSNEHLFQIDKDKLIGLETPAIQQYLGQFGIEQSEIEFFPFWIKTVPKLKDHIIIE